MTTLASKRCGPAGGSRATAEDSTNTRILAERDDDGKQAFPPLGRCVNCKQTITLTGPATPLCTTCRAWRRWYVAHRIASRYLREATR